MERHRQDWTPTPASSIDITVDAPSPLSSTGIPADECARVSLVEGSDPGMSGEVQALLRRRLRVAALLLFAGFAAFLVRSIFLIALWDQPLFIGLSKQHSIAFTVFQAVVTLLLGLCGGMLCQRCLISTRILRIKELVVFGMPAVLFLWLQYIDMTSCAGRGYDTTKQIHNLLWAHPPATDAGCNDRRGHSWICECQNNARQLQLPSGHEHRKCRPQTHPPDQDLHVGSSRVLHDSGRIIRLDVSLCGFGHS